MTRNRRLLGLVAVLVVATVVLADQAALWWGSGSPDDEAERVACWLA